VDIYVWCLSVGGPTAEVFRRFGSALGAEGDSELAKLAGLARRRLGGERLGALLLAVRRLYISPGIARKIFISG